MALSAMSCDNDGDDAREAGKDPSETASFKRGTVVHNCFGDAIPSFEPDWVGKEGMLAARQGFTTKHKASSYRPDPPAPLPPGDIFVHIRYPSPVGKLSAYLTPDPGDGRKRPAVLWAHGGFGGIGDSLWDNAPQTNDQSARAFREAGIVLMIPSWRGENDNPGNFEMFMGELDDLFAAREYLAALPYVDKERIYLAGHSTGGTLSLLAAVAPSKFKAVFSFGGWPAVDYVFLFSERWSIHDEAPFDFCDLQELSLRSPARFVEAIDTPTYFFEGQAHFNILAYIVGMRAEKAGKLLKVFQIRGGDHFDILAPITPLIASKILSEWQDGEPVNLTQSEVQGAYNEMFKR
jgi:acetyl esterase/lipase